MGTKGVGLSIYLFLLFIVGKGDIFDPHYCFSYHLALLTLLVGFSLSFSVSL